MALAWSSPSRPPGLWCGPVRHAAYPPPPPPDGPVPRVSCVLRCRGQLAAKALCECAEAVAKQKGAGGTPASYEDIAEATFGKWGRVLVSGIIYVELFGTCALLFILEVGPGGMVGMLGHAGAGLTAHAGGAQGVVGRGHCVCGKSIAAADPNRIIHRCVYVSIPR